jgi:hypothetical protein
MPSSPHWTVISSRDVLDASPFLKVRVETVELPDGRRITDYYQLEMRSFACVFAETTDGLIIVHRQYRRGARRVGLTRQCRQRRARTRYTRDEAQNGPWPSSRALLTPEARERIGRLYGTDIKAYFS